MTEAIARHVAPFDPSRITAEDIARSSPAGLLWYTRNGTWRPSVSGFHSYVNNLLLQSAYGKLQPDQDIQRIALSVPPQVGKSTIVAEGFVPWYVGTFNAPAIVTAHGDSLARKFGRSARGVFEEHGETLWGPRARLVPGVESQNEWELVGGGGVLATGLGGSVTGRGAKLVVIDDPFKGVDDSHSEVIQENVYDAFRGVTTTRLAPRGIIVVIHTRWHEGDLIGRLKQHAKDTGEEWVFVELPAIAEEDDILGRQPGESIFPERYTEKMYAERKRSMGSYLWMAMFQQAPMPATGTLFRREWFQYFTVQEYGGHEYFVLNKTVNVPVDHTGYRAPVTRRVSVDSCWLFQTIDTASEIKKENDFFVIGTWAVTPQHDLLLLAIKRFKAETPNHLKLAIEEYDQWKDVGDFRFIGVEKKEGGRNLLMALKAKGFNVIDLPADTDKKSRAMPMSARAEDGTLYILHRSQEPDDEEAKWVEVTEQELLKFPRGTHDDIVDVCSHAGIVVGQYGVKEAGGF